MIKNTKDILSYGVEKTECILREFSLKVEEMESRGNLTINSMENLLGIMFAQFNDIGLIMAGEYFSNLELEEIDEYCDCGKKLVQVKESSLTRIQFITKKEYILYFRGISEFKKVLFAAAARGGYGKIAELVVVGDGAVWIFTYVRFLPLL